MLHCGIRQALVVGAGRAIRLAMVVHSDSAAGNAVPRRTGAMALALLFLVESMARASVSTVVAVQAFDLVQDAQKVSMLFTGVGIVALFTSLMIPMALRHVPRAYICR